MFDWDTYHDQIADCGAPTCTLLREKFHRARKTHNCTHCPNQIQPGQTYRAQFWLVDNEPTLDKTCQRCLDEEIAY